MEKWVEVNAEDEEDEGENLTKGAWKSHMKQTILCLPSIMYNAHIWSLPSIIYIAYTWSYIS